MLTNYAGHYDRSFQFLITVVCEIQSKYTVCNTLNIWQEY